MVLQLDLLKFFENLPTCPLAEITKHIDFQDLIRVSLISDNWRRSISPRSIGFAKLRADYDKGLSVIKVTGFTGEKRETRAYSIDFKVFLNGEIDEKEEIDNCGVVILHRNGWNQQKILDVSTAISTLFSISFDKFQTDNSLWMTREDLLKVNCQFKHFGANQFTDKDFNAFLHSWMAGNNDNMQHYTFQVGEDVKIEEVIRGLITEKWDPKKRDRKFMTYNSDAIIQPLIDMADGYDMTKTCPDNGKLLGTVLIIDNTLHFAVWRRPFDLKFKDWWHLTDVVFYNRELAEKTDPEARERNLKKKARHLDSLRNIREDPELEVDSLEYPEDSDSDQED